METANMCMTLCEYNKMKHNENINWLQKTFYRKVWRYQRGNQNP
jgi:hypothetical protein